VAEQHVHRKFAAILAADVVGSTRPMEADEAGRLDRLKGSVCRLRRIDRNARVFQC
jgi:class 3 adenylate cyclase